MEKNYFTYNSISIALADLNTLSYMKEVFNIEIYLKLQNCV